jgi:hypothetical protein
MFPAFEVGLTKHTVFGHVEGMRDRFNRGSYLVVLLPRSRRIRVWILNRSTVMNYQSQYRFVGAPCSWT